MSEVIPWATEYGDEERERRFAGRFVGYDPILTSPSQYSAMGTKPIVLLMSDSIFGGIAWKGVKTGISDWAFLSYIQHPHHAENIGKWLDKWGIDEWKHYSLLFYFEGMHGFPPRQNLKTFKENHKVLIDRYRKIFPKIVWGNMVPIPIGFQTGLPNSEKGPNSIEQDISERAVLAMNALLKEVMQEEGIPLVDIHDLIICHQGYQRHDDLHLTTDGSIALSSLVSEAILQHLK